MSSLAPPTATIAEPPPLAGLEPLKPAARRWPTLLAAGLTIGMLAGMTYELLDNGLDGLTAAVPTSPLFYIFFALFYMTLPIGDFTIFRRLWGIPASGLIALLKKRIANDVLVNYSGEAYFYAWARACATLVAAPFGAIKDVSILSAIAGNALTLLLVVIALPLGRGLLTPDQFRTGVWSAGVLVAISLPFLIFSRRVFSLPRRQLWGVFAIHCARVVLSSTFIALAWHFALPGVSVGIWLFLAAGRLLVSRLPLIPNKELLFFTFANFVIGEREALVQHLAFLAALTLVTNIVLFIVFAGHGLLRKGKWW